MMSTGNKPILTVEQQIEHLKDKDIQFNIMSEADAVEYLMYKNNYYKLTAYRKNYAKHPGGVNAGKYIHLEFAYLVDLATIDMYLRYQIVLMALDIEHHVKLRLLREIEHHAEDGYSIVDDFIRSLPPGQLSIFKNEIYRNHNNIYCGDIVQKYTGQFPVWALLELIPFGRLISFYKFCAVRFQDRKMISEHYMLLNCKEIRNACAHSNCILNDLRAGSALHQTDSAVTNAMVPVNGITRGSRRNRMSNARIQQMVTLFYMYRTTIASDALWHHGASGIREVRNRMVVHRDYYNDNPLISGTFSFLEILIDNWF